MVVPKEIRSAAVKLQKAGEPIPMDQIAILKDFFAECRQQTIQNPFLCDSLLRAEHAMSHRSTREMKWLRRWIKNLLSEIEKETNQ
ncbi:MAG: hypothetical protein ACTHKB_15660 [Burkholderiaceae bacterium]